MSRYTICLLHAVIYVIYCICYIYIYTHTVQKVIIKNKSADKKQKRQDFSYLNDDNSKNDGCTLFENIPRNKAFKAPVALTPKP